MAGITTRFMDKPLVPQMMSGSDPIQRCLRGTTRIAFGLRKNGKHLRELKAETRRSGLKNFVKSVRPLSDPLRATMD